MDSVTKRFWGGGEGLATSIRTLLSLRSMKDKSDLARKGYSEVRLPPNVFKDGDYYVSVKDNSKMVLIPYGDFEMGVETEDIFAKAHEKPKRVVTLSPYLIDIYPITNEQYKQFIETGGYEKEAYWTKEGWKWKSQKGVDRPLAWGKEGWNAPLQPVCGTSWYEASAYARWANKQLPAEAQWEKAARGTDGRRYPWGNDFPTTKIANFNNSIGRTTEVNRYSAGRSLYGCYDMAGNVNNWCEDWYWSRFYKYCVENNINKDPVLDDRLIKMLGVDASENILKTGNLLKVDRGGGFATTSECWEVLSCTDKVAWPPYERNYWNGFRTVIVLPYTAP